MKAETKDYISHLEIEFQRMANPAIAQGQKAYMKNHFEFYGIKTPDRREVQKPFLVKEFLPEKGELDSLMAALWSKPQREFQLFGLDMAARYKKEIQKSDLDLFEKMITGKSWWDTVDFIAVHLVGLYFTKFPGEIDGTVEKWMKSQNMWLQRTCLLFQLKYKNRLDTQLLTHVIVRLTGSKEFFINKAIGWVLREYGKTHPDWVVKFVNMNELSGLSRREALRLIQ